MNDLDTFVAAKLAAPVKVGNTPENLGQCVGLVEVWFDTELEPHVWGDARDLYANAGAGYSKGASWPAPAGAAGVLDGSWGGGAGHTFISLGDGWVLEQNNPAGSPPKRSYYGTLPPHGWIGWILPNNFKPGESGMIITRVMINYIWRGFFDAEPPLKEVDYWTGRSDAQEFENYLAGLYQANEPRRWKANNYDAVNTALTDARVQVTSQQDVIRVLNEHQAILQGQLTAATAVPSQSSTPGTQNSGSPTTGGQGQVSDSGGQYNSSSLDLKSFLTQFNKFWVALAGFGGVAGTALGDGKLSLPEAQAIGIALLAALAVLRVPNIGVK